MTNRTAKPRPKMATLAELRASCREAPVIWLALCEMAVERGANLVTPSRELLSKRTGIKRMKTISAALTALELAGWIQRKHVPVKQGGKQLATLILVVLNRVPQRDTVQSNHRGRKTPRMAKTTIEGEKRPSTLGRKSPQDSLKRESAPLPAGAERRPQTNPTHEENPITRIENERLALIRAAREAGEAKAQEVASA